MLICRDIDDETNFLWKFGELENTGSNLSFFRQVHFQVDHKITVFSGLKWRRSIFRFKTMTRQNTPSCISSTRNRLGMSDSSKESPEKIRDLSQKKKFQKNLVDEDVVDKFYDFVAIALLGTLWGSLGTPCATSK